ncbi:hypothetical protein [Shewanella sp. VB17]|nr:hypothetical protein [Shewanella sp. VB17]
MRRIVERIVNTDDGSVALISGIEEYWQLSRYLDNDIAAAIFIQ